MGWLSSDDLRRFARDGYVVVERWEQTFLDAWTEYPSLRTAVDNPLTGISGSDVASKTV